MLLGLLFIVILLGCGDIESPTSTEEYVETVYVGERLPASSSSSSLQRLERSSSSSKIWRSSSSYSYFWTYSSSSHFSSSSSYSSSLSARQEYLTEDMLMELSLTYYKQLKSYEGTSVTTDGDPIIYFKVIATDYYGDTLANVKTSKFFDSKSDKANVSVWSGDSSVFLTLPQNTYEVSVCPVVYDYDPLVSDNMSSGYCYIRWGVGLLELYEKVYQKELNSTNYELEWNWKLY